MTFLRNLQHDLVDKKLWPVALVLVVALIAIPLILSAGGDDKAPLATTTTPADSEVAAVPPSGSEVSVTAEESVLRKRGGKTRDPFKQQYVPPDVTVDGPSTTTPETGGTSTTPTTGDGTTTTPGAPTDEPELPAVDPLDVYRVSLRFGEPGEQRTIRDIARLSPLPNSDRPFFVFLGVLNGGKRAVFLVSSDATATGDGTCRPTKLSCETVELEKGETEFFDYQTESGVVQYQLDLVNVKRRVPLSSTEAVAAQARARAEAARKMAAAKKARDRAVKQGTDDADADELGTDIYRWDEKLGVLVRRKPSSKGSVNIGDGLMGPLRDAGDGWQAGDSSADDAPAVVG